MNNLLSVLLPDGDFKSFSGVDHNDTFEDSIKHYLEKRKIFSRFRREEMFFPKAVGLSAFYNVISICDTTYYNVNDTCNSVIIYSPENLTDEQNSIMLQLYEEHLKFIDNITIALVDNNCKFSQCQLDDYISNLNHGSKKIV